MKREFIKKNDIVRIKQSGHTKKKPALSDSRWLVRYVAADGFRCQIAELRENGFMNSPQIFDTELLVKV